MTVRPPDRCQAAPLTPTPQPCPRRSIAHRTAALEAAAALRRDLAAATRRADESEARALSRTTATASTATDELQRKLRQAEAAAAEASARAEVRPLRATDQRPSHVHVGADGAALVGGFSAAVGPCLRRMCKHA